jgi:membrane protein YqaA with SNARE-associated domain
VTDLPTATPAFRRRAAFAALALTAAAAGFGMLFYPDAAGLVGYGLYAIPAHLLISFLAHEPALFAAANAYPAAVVATVGTFSCCIAIILDYWLIGWFVSRRLVRDQFDRSRAYGVAQRIFRKAPFLLIVGSALAPVPFYPVKILAIANDYSIIRFIAALIIGRWPRFYLLAIGGQKVNPPNRVLLYAGIGLGVLALYQIWRTRRQRNQIPP